MINRPIISVLVLLFTILFSYSCGTDIDNELDTPRVKVEEVIANIYQLPNGATCDFMLQYNTTYLPLNLPDSMRIDDLDVIVTFEYTGEKQTCSFDDGNTVEENDFETIDILEIRRY